MFCGGDLCNSANFGKFSRDPPPAARMPGLSRALIKARAILYEMQRRQVAIEIEKARQRGLLTERHMRFLSDVGLI
jgi:hypothetical protein